MTTSGFLRKIFSGQHLFLLFFYSKLNLFLFFFYLSTVHLHETFDVSRYYLVHTTQWLFKRSFNSIRKVRTVRTTVIATTLISASNFVSLFIVCSQIIDTLETGVFWTLNRLSFVSNNQTGGMYNTDKIKTRQTCQVQNTAVWVSCDVEKAEIFFRAMADFDVSYSWYIMNHASFWAWMFTLSDEQKFMIFIHQSDRFSTQFM